MSETLATNKVNIAEFAEANPDSQMLSMVAQGNLGDGKWWDTLCDEYEASTISTIEALAAFCAVMHSRPGTDTQKIVNRARLLVTGEPVVTYTTPRDGIKFEPSLSGVLAMAPSALLGHPDNRKDPKNYARLFLGLSLVDRSATVELEPFDQYVVGEENILELYGRAYGDRGHNDWPGTPNINLAERLVNASVMAKLGLLVVKSEFVDDANALVDLATSYITEESPIKPWDSSETLRDLPNVALIDPSRAEEAIDHLIAIYPEDLCALGSSWFNDFAVTVATIRSPKALRSLPIIDTYLEIAKAKVELLTKKAAQAQV